MKEFDLIEGDKIRLMHMEGEGSIKPLTIGVVTKIVDSPFQEDEKIIYVNWENGSQLSLLSSVDVWKKIEPKKISESSIQDFYRKNEDFIKSFDRKFFRAYLLKIRESGIVNMFEAAPLLYSGAEHIDRYYGENPPDEEAFMEVLEMANTAKNKMIQGCIKYLESKGEEVSVESVNRAIRQFSKLMLEFYIKIT